MVYICCLHFLLLPLIPQPAPVWHLPPLPHENSFCLTFVLTQWAFLLSYFFLATFLDISSFWSCLMSSFLCHEMILVYFPSFLPFLLSHHRLIIYYLSTECLSSSRLCFGPCPFLYYFYKQSYSIDVYSLYL